MSNNNSIIAAITSSYIASNTKADARLRWETVVKPILERYPGAFVILHEEVVHEHEQIIRGAAETIYPDGKGLRNVVIDGGNFVAVSTLGPNMSFSFWVEGERNRIDLYPMKANSLQDWSGKLAKAATLVRDNFNVSQEEIEALIK